MGLRTALVQSDSTEKKLRLFLGNGAMLENEKLHTTPVSQTKIIRSTNYISFQMQLNNLINLIFVGYYQVNLERFQDYRILVESPLGFNLTKSLIFQTNLNLRFDNEPPMTIKKYDLELTMDWKFHFER